VQRLLILCLMVLALPAAAAAADGAGLYAANCSRCHGPNGQGTAHDGPPLRSVGPIAADFYVRTGYMPLRNPNDQPSRSRVLFTEGELRALITYVGSLGGGGPRVPHPKPAQGTVASGRTLFAQRCAGCHQAVAEGGYVSGARVPPLTKATPTQIAEAVRIGPYLMPHFSKNAISDRQLDDLIAYVQYTKHPDDRGGWAIGHLGPWPEGVISWLVATAALVFVCTLLGRRIPK
jgi:ubiquinol-cytochrome c reductase cytochrome c subunit